MVKLGTGRMSGNAEYLGMIKQAQLGSRDCMSRLAEEAKVRVFVYIYRITLDYHLAQDLSQETMLEMLKSLKRLKVESVNPFWSWLYRTALGKIQHHFKYQGNRRIEQRTIFDGGELLKRIPKDRHIGLESLLHKELSQVILKAMGQMKVAYRNILTLRCFEEMSYAEIAAVTGVSDMQARLQFFRAKQSLKKQLAQNGFKKEHLLPALGLFGAITASFTKPVSAATTISSAVLKVGVPTAIIGTAASKSGVVAVVTAAIVTLPIIGTVKVFKNDVRVYHAAPVSNTSLRDLVHTRAFENPSSLVRAYDPDGSGWKATDSLTPQQPAIPILPEQLLVGPRQQNSLFVILPERHWLELGFSGDIVDGRGIDICFDGRVTGKPPIIFITDGAGQEVQITSAPSYQDGGGGYGFTAYDISGLSLPFKPRALRIVGADNKGPWVGAEIWAVWARVSH